MTACAATATACARPVASARRLPRCAFVRVFPAKQQLNGTLRNLSAIANTTLSLTHSHADGLAVVSLVVCYGMACADFLDSFNSDFQFNPDLFPLSGGGESAAETPTEEDHKDNPDAAPCTAAPNDRLWHAARVFHKWRARRFGAMISRGRGQIINVTFTDGGTERYMWIPGSLPAHTSPPELYLTAVPGTKSCQ